MKKTYLLPGLLIPPPSERPEHEAALARELSQLGVQPGTVELLAWHAENPRKVAAVLASVGGIGGVASGRGGLVAAGLTLAGAGTGLGVAYSAVRSRITAASEELARRLTAAVDEGVECTLVAHSTGTEVVLSALDYMASWQRRLAGRVYLLGGTAEFNRDYSRATSVVDAGVFNIWNPLDGWLLLENLLRWTSTIGRRGMTGSGVTSVQTDLGHREQLVSLARAARGFSVRHARPWLPAAPALPIYAAWPLPLSR